MLQNVEGQGTELIQGGLVTLPNVFNLKPGQTPDCLNVNFNVDGSVEKMAGSTTLNSVAIMTATSAGFYPDSNNTIAASLEAYWKLDEASGTRSSSIGITDLIDKNTVGSTTGKSESAAVFVAANSEYLVVHSDSSTQFAPNSDWGMSLWIYVTASPTINRMILSKYPTRGADSPNIEQELFYTPAGNITWAVWKSDLNNVSITASKFGVVSTGAWHHIACWWDSANQLGYIQIDNSGLTINSASVASLNSGNASFTLGVLGDTSNSFWNGYIDEVGIWRKQLTAQHRTDLYNSGNANTYDPNLTSAGFGMFDFGAGTDPATNEPLRWLVVAAGTGIWASSNRGVTFVVIATDRGAARQYFTRSKSWLIATSETQNKVLYWAGSVGTYMAALAVGSAPPAKHVLDYNGFTLLMNDSGGKRRISYSPSADILTDPFNDTFDIPSSKDDEITGGEILRKSSYIFTRSSVHRVSAVGGNPDFSETTVKTGFGAVPGTIVKASYMDIGEVLIFLSYDKKVRIFDGAEDRIISTAIEQDNGICRTYLDNLNGDHIGQSHGVVDTERQEYNLHLVMSPSNSITHNFVLNLRTGEWSPHLAQEVNAVVMAESANAPRTLLGVKKDGFIYQFNTGNLNGTSAIDEYFTSHFMFGSQGPRSVAKGHKMNYYFKATSSGTIHLQDQFNFSQGFETRDKVILSDTTNKHIIHKSADLPATFNAYRFKITSSASTADPWKLYRFEPEITTKGRGAT